MSGLVSQLWRESLAKVGTGFGAVLGFVRSGLAWVWALLASGLRALRSKRGHRISLSLAWLLLVAVLLGGSAFLLNSAAGVTAVRGGQHEVGEIVIVASVPEQRSDDDQPPVGEFGYEVRRDGTVELILASGTNEHIAAVLLREAMIDFDKDSLDKFQGNGGRVVTAVVHPSYCTSPFDHGSPEQEEHCGEQEAQIVVAPRPHPGSQIVSLWGRPIRPVVSGKHTPVVVQTPVIWSTGRLPLGLDSSEVVAATGIEGWSGTEWQFGTIWMEGFDGLELAYIEYADPDGRASNSTTDLQIAGPRLFQVNCRAETQEDCRGLGFYARYESPAGHRRAQIELVLAGLLLATAGALVATALVAASRRMWAH
jgi:hypothetical protein